MAQTHTVVKGYVVEDAGPSMDAGDSRAVPLGRRVPK